jgi:anti-sigma regulatory factor (Ser/Thr protein kinase)
LSDSSSTSVEHVIDSSTHSVRRVLSQMEELLLQTGTWTENERLDIQLALDEALANAVYHGTLEIEPRLRARPDNAASEMAKARRSQAPYCHRRIRVSATVSPSEAAYEIEDEGPGFDPAALVQSIDLDDLERFTGRGILLIRSVMDEVSFNAKGNRIRMVKRRSVDERASE